MTLPDFIKYFSGKTSVKESKEVLDWMRDPKNDYEVRDTLGKAWTHSDIRLKGRKPDFEKLLSSIHKHMGNYRPFRMIRLMPVYQSFSRIAAILILPLLFLTVYFYLKSGGIWTGDNAGAIQQEIYTKPGIRTKITLGDGTLVWLHDGTTLRYPDHFTTDQRRVFVDGEAYFEVVSDSDRPFIVENPMMETVVTGTKFNLNAYSSDLFFEATLIEGKIQLQNGQKNYRMKPGQQIQYDPKTEKVSQFEVNPYLSAAWINGKLIMQDEPLSVAVKKISRWYNIEIVMRDPELHRYFLTATIQNEKPEQTLRLISMALPVDYSETVRQTGNGPKRIFYLKKR